jgi:uncharacterized membrane protein
MLMIAVQVGLLSLAFERLGLSQASGFTLLIVSLFGSGINLPLFTIRSETPLEPIASPWHGLLRLPPRPFTGKTLVAINVGGCLIPVTFSIYLLMHNPIGIGTALLAIAIVTAVSYFSSRPIQGLGIGMPIFIAPITAALTAHFFNQEIDAPLAYICGTLGVLIGADLLRLGDIRKMGTPFASIGGAGTFDGIFMTGIVAVLLA